MIDAIDTDMNARAGNAELIPWLLVRNCAPQHVAKEIRSIMRDTRSHIKLCYVQRNFTAYTQPLDRTYMRAFNNSICQTLSRVLLGSRVQLRTCQSVLQHTGAPPVGALIRAHSRTERRQRATSNCWLALHRLERGGASSATRRSKMSSGDGRTVSTRHKPKSLTATDSEPEAHVMEPLADDHSSEGEDTPTGVEESVDVAQLQDVALSGNVSLTRPTAGAPAASPCECCKRMSCHGHGHDKRISPICLRLNGHDAFALQWYCRHIVRRTQQRHSRLPPMRYVECVIWWQRPVHDGHLQRVTPLQGDARCSTPSPF